MLRLMIIGDQSAVRKGLQMRFAAETDLLVVGEAIDCNTALEAAQTVCPDVIVIDADMERSNGLEIATRLHEICEDVVIVLLSIRDNVQSGRQNNPINTFPLVNKTQPAEMLLSAIRTGSPY